MFELDAARFYEVVTKLQHTRTAIKYRDKLKDGENRSSSEPITDEVTVRVTVQRIDDLLISLAALNARVTTMAAQELRDRLTGRYTLTYQELADGFEDISVNLRRELTNVRVLVLEPKEMGYFNPTKPLLGEKFASGFAGEGTFGADEAGKCLALQRPTACVFHLMRVMEVGIRAVARCLQM